MKAWLLYALLGLLSFVSPAWAQSSCDDALVKSTYSSFSTDDLAWQLAFSVSEKTYDEIKHDAGADAVIYGIPVGASYSDFEQAITDKEQSYNASLTHDQAINIMWTGLDPTAANDYTACLNAYIQGTRGLHLGVKYATQSDITLVVGWVPQGAGDPNTIHASWSVPAMGATHLPTKFTAGQTTVVVPRPNKELSLAINYPGFTDSVILEPLPVNVPPPVPVVPAQTSCGGMNPSMTVTAYSDQGPGNGFDPATSSENQWLTFPNGNTTNLAHLGESYFYNGGGWVDAHVDTSCSVGTLSPTSLNQTIQISSTITGTSGHCCSGFGPGGAGIINPTWQTSVTLPGNSQVDQWKLDVVTSVSSNFPQRSCQIAIDGNITPIGISNNVLNSFKLFPGIHQIQASCNSPVQYEMRPGNWDAPGQVTETITLALSGSSGKQTKLYLPLKPAFKQN